ncbi:MAG: ECF-type sigma factor, partial [Acidobacteriota bacterium]
ARDRREFLALAAHGMRRVLVDSARRRRAGKRGSDEWRQVSLADGMGSHPAEGDLVDVLALHAALEKLATLSERQARVAELRAFGGLTLAETAETLGVGTTVVKAEWQVARAWLRRELARDTPDPEPPADTEPR